MFVDDVAAEASNPDASVVEAQLAHFLDSVCSRLTADGLEISASKSVVTAYTPELGRCIAARPKRFGITFTKWV